MIKQKKVLVNTKAKNISVVLGVDEKRARKIADFADKAYHKEKSYTKALELCKKEAKNQEEFVWAIHNLGFTKGYHSGLEKAAKITAQELTSGLMGKLFGGPSKNDSFWGTLDAIFVCILFVNIIHNFLNFNWFSWIIVPLNIFLIWTTFSRRLK